MKILVIARPYSVYGGVETATSGLLGALAAGGHEVHRAGPGTYAPHPGMTDHRLRMPPLPSPLRALALAVAAARLAREGAWDVVQSHERTFVQDVYRAGEGCHLGYVRALGGVEGRRLHHRVTLALERRVFARTPAIVAISRTGGAEIGELYGVPASRLSVVYNGVDLERFHPRLRARERAVARAEVGVTEDAPLLLFVGSGFRRKGLDVAIQALARLDAPAGRLVVIGRGDTAPYRALAAAHGVVERVVWLGVRADIERWYAAADALVLPTRYEPFGNVHLEALATGLPVVTSRRAGGAEVVSDAAGAVVDPESPQEVADAIARLRARPKGEATAAARVAAEPYTFVRQVGALERVYARISRRNRCLRSQVAAYTADVAARPAVFIDRDGTLTEEVGYVNHPRRLRLLPRSAEAIRRLNAAGIAAVVATNQAGLARGYFSEEVMHAVNDELACQLKAEGARLDGLYVCTHHPTAGEPPYRADCECRKPRPGLLVRAARELGLDLRASTMIGDKASDLEAGYAAGTRGVLVLTGYGLGDWQYRRDSFRVPPDHVADDLLSAVEWVLRDQAAA